MNIEHNEINKCRMCVGKLKSLLNIGNLHLTGVFPKNKTDFVPKLPLHISKCNKCELIQLKDNFDVSKLYGETYGYRSGLNNSMVLHLEDIVKYLKDKVILKTNDIVIDIGSNDGTMLNKYNDEKLNYVGIDPTAKKYLHYYNKNINVICDFFTESNYRDNTTFNKNQKVKIISTISMFYDLPEPLQFVKDIHNILDEDGVWFSEQSYFPDMIKNKSFDTICQEHIEYYCLKQIKYMADNVGFKIIDIGFNFINGGSFYTLLVKKNSNKYIECTDLINKILNEEKLFFQNNIIENFNNEINIVKTQIFELFHYIQNNNLTIHGYGASTKGNVLLQYFNITDKYLKYICEVNEYKFGRYTPGTLIPIISEEKSKIYNPNYYFVLPWHFKENIVQKEHEFLKNGGKLVFPLPNFQIIDINNCNL
jgi:hypothetical protein